MIGLLDTAAIPALTTGLSSDLIAGWYGARANANSLAANNIAAAAARDAGSVVPPWDVRLEQPTQDERLRAALGGGAFIDEAASKLSNADATLSEQKLFALYAGLAKLSAIAAHAADKTTPDIMLASLNARFADGLAQVLDYAGTINQSDLVVLPGDKAAKLDADVRVPRQLSTYTTKVIHRAVTADAMTGLTGGEQFTIAVTKGGATTNVDVDLAGIGPGPISLDALIGFINQRLESAGMVTRFKKERIVTLDKDGKEPSPLPQTWALTIQGTSTERLTFSAPTAGTAVYLAGVSGKPGEASAQMIKLDASGAAPKLMTSARIEAASEETATEETSAAETRVSGSTIDADGNLYVVGTSKGSLGGDVLLGTSDAYLTKYDSTGQIVWQRMLGAAEAAEGAAVAVDGAGNVVIAGRVKAGLDGSQSNQSYNGFVTKFDRTGQEIFSHDIGPMSDDAAAAVAIGADGAIYIGGRTKGAIVGGAVSAGGEDAFIKKLSAAGDLLYARQFGTSSNDRITGLALDVDGNLVALSMQGTRAVVSKFDAASGSSAALWSQDLGDLAGGEAAALTASGGTIYVGGATASGTIGGGSINGAYQGGTDGFVAAIDGDGAVQSTTFVGTLSTDRIRSVAVAGGAVYVAGDTTGDLGAGFTGTHNGFAAKLGAAGALDWVYQYSGRNGQARAHGVNVDAQGASVLDVLGLPKGRLDYTEATTLPAQSAVRAGDEFSIAVNGGPPRRITIKADETLNSLAFKINAVLGLHGKASVRRVDGASSIRIVPGAPGVRIDFIAGADGKDALKALGMAAGTIIDTSSAQQAETQSGGPVLNRIFGADEETAAPNYVGLGLNTGLTLESRAHANAANQQLQNAMAALRSVFRTLDQDPTLAALLNSPNGNKKGAVPAYLTAQLANYKAGLARLSAGPPDITTLL